MTRRNTMESRTTAKSQGLPLIPAPKSFLERKASLSLSTSSLSSSKNSYQFPSPPPSLPPPSPPPPVLISQNFPSALSLPPPPLEVNDISNRLRSETSGAYNSKKQYSSETPESYSGKSPPPISSLFTPLSTSQPPSPLPSDPPSFVSSSSSIADLKFAPPPSFTNPSTTTTSQTSPDCSSTSISSPKLSPPKSDGREERKHSVSPSEVVGYFDEAIGDHDFSTNSCNDNTDYPEISSTFLFSSKSDENLHETPVKEPRKIKKHMGEEVVFSRKNYPSDNYHEDDLSRTDITATKRSANADAHDVQSVTQEVVRKRSDTLHSIDTFDFSDAHFKADSTPTLSPTPREKGKKKPNVSPKKKPNVSPKKVVVSKLLSDLKTVSRQQIKPGTVGELADLFSHMTEEHVTSPSKPGCDFNIHETVDKLGSLERENNEQLTLTPGSQHSSHNEFSFQRHISKPNANNTTLHQHQTTYAVKQSQELSTAQSDSVLDMSTALPDPRAMPGLDFLSASREMIKRAVSSKMNNRTSSVDKEKRTRDEKVHINNHTLPSKTAATTSESSKNNRANSSSIKDRESNRNNSQKGSLKKRDKSDYVNVDLNNASFSATPTASENHVNVWKEGDMNAWKSSTDTAHELNKSENIRGEGRPVYAKKTERYHLTTGGQEGHGTQPLCTSESTPKVFLKYVTDDEKSACTFNTAANSPKNDTPSPRFSTSGQVNNSNYDEVNRINASPVKKNGSIVNSISLHSKPHMVSDAEPLRTLTNSFNIYNSLETNKGQQFAFVNNYNTSNDTPGGTETGSEDQVQTNQASLRSRLLAGTQGAGTLQRDNDSRETGLEHSTSSSRHENPIVCTTVDTTSNNDITMSDDGNGTHLSEVSRGDPTTFSDMEPYRADSDVPDTSMSMTNGEGDIFFSSNNTKHYNNYGANGDFNIEDIPHKGHEIIDNIHRQGSFTTDVANEVREAEGDKHMQTVPHYSAQNTEECGSMTETQETTDDVVLRNTVDTFHLPMSSQLDPEKNTNVDTEEIIVETLNGGSSTQMESDDFMTLLEDIKIMTDITSTFLRSSRRSGRYSHERQQDDQQITSGADNKDTISKEEHAAQLVSEESAKGIYTQDFTAAENLHQPLVEMSTKGREHNDSQFDLAMVESTEFTAATPTTFASEDINLNEEIMKQHSVLSPMLSEHSEYDKSLNLDLVDKRNSINSFSSTQGSEKADDSIITKATLFNNEFFSRSEKIAKTSSQISSGKDSLNKRAERSGSTPGSEYEAGIKNLPESEWIIPTESSRLIPWPEYEEKTQIQFQIAADTGEKGPNEDTNADLESTSFNGIMNSAPDSENKRKKDHDVAFTNEVFTKSEGITNNTNQHPPTQESIIEATVVSRLIPWADIEESLEKEKVSSVHTDGSGKVETKVTSFNSDFFKEAGEDLPKNSQPDLINESSGSVTRFSPHTDLTNSVDFSDISDDEHSSGNESERNKYKSTEHKEQVLAQMQQNRFDVGDDSKYIQQDNRVDFMEINEEKTGALLAAQTSHEISYEKESVKQNEDDSNLFSKDKFHTLKKVFEGQQLENQSKPLHASFQAKRNSFKFAPNPSSPTRAVSGSKNEENGEISVQDVRNVASHLETREHTSRDFGHEGVDLHIPSYRSTEIDTKSEDSEHSVSSNESTSGSDVDTLSTRTSKKKSKQTNLSYDLQTPELDRDSLSQSSGLETSLLKGSLRRSQIRAERSNAWSESDHSSVEPDTGTRSSETFSSKCVQDNDVTGSVKTFSSSYILSAEDKKDTLNHKADVGTLDNSVTYKSFGESLQDAETKNKQNSDRSSLSNSENFSDVIEEISRSQQESVKSRLPHSSFETEDINIYAGLSQTADVPEKNRSSSNTETETEIYKHSLDFGDRVRRRSSAESDRQTELIDAFLKSSVNLPERNSDSLKSSQHVLKPVSHANAGTNSERSHSPKESNNHLQENGSYSNNQHVDPDQYNLSNKITAENFRETFSDNSEPNFSRRVSEDRRNSQKMTAVVGEVSSFSIHKKMTSHEESFSEQSGNISASVVDSPDKHHDQSASDIYLIQDKKGDYYALQEVDDSQTNTNVLGKNANLHVVESDRADGHYRTFNGHNSKDMSSMDNDYYPSDGARTDLYVDSSAVEDNKAREVISAYLDAQESSRQRGLNNSTHEVFTFQESSAASKHHYSQPDKAGQWDSSIADDNTGMRFKIINSNIADAPTFVSSPNNGSVVVQTQGYRGVTNDEYLNSSGYKYSHLHQNNAALSGSIDNSQRNKSGHEYFLSNGADQDSYVSSLRLTNLSTPQAHLAHPTVVDTAQDTHRFSEYPTSATSASIQHRTDNIEHFRDRSAVNPFLTQPITITTTTQAVVGEQVGMHIDYSPTAGGVDAFNSSSEDESKHKRYVVRNIAQKSSLKNSSRHDTNSFSDSSSDIVFTKVGTVAADVNQIGNTRGIILHTQNREMRPVNDSDSLSPRSVVDGPVHRVYQSPQSQLTRSLSPSEDRSYYKQDVNENFFSLNRETEGNNLYRVRNLSTSVPDGLHNTQHRGESRTRSSNNSDTQKAYKVVRKQHHSPERFFKNPRLSLRKQDDDDDNVYYSEEGENKRYRTVTKVHLNELQPRSRSQSPETRYKVSSLQSQVSSEIKRNQVAENDNRIYEVVTVKSSDNQHNGSPGFSDETDSGYQEQQRRYRVIGNVESSQERHVVRAHSSPKLGRQERRSLEEATITLTESVQPSRLNNNPPSTKKHKTVIQLDVTGNKIKEKKSSDQVDTLYKLQRTKSVDDLQAARTVVNVLSQSSDERKMWRTGKSSSTDKYRRRSSSGDADDDSDLEHTGVYDSSPRVVKTLKQKDGNKMYVVNSTMGDPTETATIHPPGFYRSTIDINEEKIQHDKQFVTLQERPHFQNYRNEKTVYFERQTTPLTNGGKVFQRTHSTEFVYPDSGQGTEIASSDGENELRQKMERVERIYEIRSEAQLPEQFHSMEDLSNDLRVLRGNILIKNRLNDTDHDADDFDENVNLFDNSFHLGKDNPLFSSDQDLLASLQREEEQDISRHVHQDITFESVDKIAHEYKGERLVQIKPPQQRKKQNLSELLLSKLASVDSKDIRQTIDVEHHNEEIYGDIDFIHADGERKTSNNTRNFDSVNEKVELTLTQGKAYVIIKVIAERIVPTDYEFNVWRKSQAIVTRQIEIDLLANEQRRRLYKNVMASAGTAGSLENGSRSHYYDSEALSPQERQLSSMETLKLFSQILDVTDGQGDKDYTQTQTRQEMAQLPPSAMDLLY